MTTFADFDVMDAETACSIMNLPTLPTLDENGEK
nr:MAG TPA: hypothetical protein [Caudoviricetes sp.]